jgi:hypothetical protein
MLYVCAAILVKDSIMITASRLLIIIFAGCLVVAACGPMNYLKGGIYKDLDTNLTIVGLTENPNNYLNKDVVFSVRYFKKGDLPCPLGDDYVNFIIADRVSYITLNKVWVKKEKAGMLDKLKENETIVMKARVFSIDKEKDPNLEAIEIIPE